MISDPTSICKYVDVSSDVRSEFSGEKPIFPSRQEYLESNEKPRSNLLT